MDYSYNDYQSRQSYYSTYPQILPSTLSSFENDLPFYNATFASGPTSAYNGNIYFSPDPSIAGNSYNANQMLPTTLSNRFLVNDSNNNFGKD